jgi:hypothetical protein
VPNGSGGLMRASQILSLDAFRPRLFRLRLIEESFLARMRESIPIRDQNGKTILSQ